MKGENVGVAFAINLACTSLVMLCMWKELVGFPARIVFAIDFGFFRTCCAGPAAPLGDFCADSLRERLRVLSHLLCWSGCALRRLLRGFVAREGGYRLASR